MPEKTKSRKGGKKNRKQGRNSRKPGSSRQAYRTAHNKATTMFFEELKAKRQLSWTGATDDALAILTTLRNAWKREFGTTGG